MAMNQDQRNNETPGDAGNEAGNEASNEAGAGVDNDRNDADTAGTGKQSGTAADEVDRQPGAGAPADETDQGDDGGQAGERGQPDQGDARDDSEELARMKEAMLRLRAEMDNREKRLEREMAKTRKFALESLLRDLVQVLDSMDQALAAADPDDAESLYEGMELTRKQAIQVLGSHGLEVLDPVGEAFDPSWHEAMTTQPSDEQAPDTILQVLQKGYRLNDRLIRPARVIVAKEA